VNAKQVEIADPRLTHACVDIRLPRDETLCEKGQN
jgi:hypothetical protein